MLSIQSIDLMAGSKLLLQQASLTIHPGQKVGLIGANGAGKSTLFKAILNQVPLEAGQIQMPEGWLVGYVEQEQSHLHMTALDYVMQGDSLYAKVRAKIDDAELLNSHQDLVAAYDQLDFSLIQMRNPLHNLI